MARNQTGFYRENAIFSVFVEKKKQIPFDILHFLDNLIKDPRKELQTYHLVRKFVIGGSSSWNSTGRSMCLLVVPPAVAILKTNSAGWFGVYRQEEFGVVSKHRWNSAGDQAPC